MQKFIFYCLVICSVFPINASDWKKISEKTFFKEINKKFFEKILQNRQIKLYWNGELLVPYSSCGEDFPVLPGGFPCSFLSDEISDGKEPLVMDVEGGRIEIKVSKENSQFGGKVFLISDEEEKDRDEFLILAFYNKHNYISHYFHKNYLVLFKWEGKGEVQTLVKIYQIQFTPENQISSIKRISF